jgi:hypothetical protein
VSLYLRFNRMAEREQPFVNTVEVGVKGRANERVQLNGLAQSEWA